MSGISPSAGSDPCRPGVWTRHSRRTRVTTRELPSKLPSVGTTIFTVMSKLATDLGAINLSQGFPDFDCDPALIDAVARYMREGGNQYAPMQGVPALREAISAKYETFHSRRYDP